MRGAIEVMRRRARAGAPADGGFTLVEVIVATGVFVVVSIAVLTLVINAISTTGANADRVFAASIARSEVERLRAIGPAGIAPGTTVSYVTDPAGEGNRTFTVTRTANWVGLGQGTTLCNQGGAFQPAYMRVEVAVVGGRLGAPQTADTLLYEFGSQNPNAGTIVVIVRDTSAATPVPVPGATVTGTLGGAASPAFTLVTDSGGCVTVPDSLSGSWSVTATVTRPYTFSPPSSTLTQTQTGQLAPRAAGALPDVRVFTFSVGRSTL